MPSSKFPRKWKRGELLGQGRFGKVYLLIDICRPKDEKYVIKDMMIPISQNDQSLREFKRETEILSILEDHERIVPYHGNCITKTLASIFLGYMSYRSLHNFYQKNGPLSEEKCILFTKQILEGLDYLHERRIIHRDIKGSNVLLENENHTRLSDFGISKFLDSSLNTKTLELGTSRWMAPEVLNPDISEGSYNYLADIWSAGCTVVEMLTGDVPYAYFELEQQVLYQVGQGIPPNIPDGKSKGLSEIVKRMMLLKKPAERKTAEQILEKLEQITSKQVNTKKDRVTNFVTNMLSWNKLNYDKYETSVLFFIVVIAVIAAFNVIAAFATTTPSEGPMAYLKHSYIFMFLIGALYLPYMYFTMISKDIRNSEVFISNNNIKIGQFHSENCTEQNHDCVLSLSDFKKHFLGPYKRSGYRKSQKLYDLIICVSNLTVLLTVSLKKCNKFRYFYFSLFKYAFALNKDSKINGTGIVYRVMKYSKSNQRQNCSGKETKSDSWAEIQVMTSAKLIPDEWKNCSATCRFFFDSPTKLGISVEVVGIEEIDVKNDWCILKCVSCDDNLVRKLDVEIDTFEKLRLSVYNKYRQSRKENKVGFIVSHPFGGHKHVSLGHWDRKTVNNEIWSRYKYSIKTFPGCAGAYVHFLGYSGKVWHYPHLHNSRKHSGPGFHVKESIEYSKCETGEVWHYPHLHNSRKHSGPGFHVQKSIEYSKCENEEFLKTEKINNERICYPLSGYDKICTSMMQGTCKREFWGDIPKQLSTNQGVCLNLIPSAKMPMSCPNNRLCLN